MKTLSNGRYVEDLSTFYPMQFGLSAPAIMPMNDQSSFMDGGDGDEDSIEYEGEENEIGGIEEKWRPKFRELVRNKKLELKAQYGKGHFEFQGCGIAPLCAVFIDCSKQRNYDKECCVKVREWNKCRENGNWVPGWRKKWREFKRAGGLAQLKLQAKGLVPTPPSRVPFYKIPMKVQRAGVFGKKPGAAGDSGSQTTQTARAQGNLTPSIILFSVIIILFIIMLWWIFKKSK